jgi:hypothetical protein
MAKESVFNQEEKDSIKITKFIFHIIIEDKLYPIFLDEVELNDEQLKFFKKRFEDASEGTQYLFLNKETSLVHNKCQEILGNIPKYFHENSKDITTNFKQHHNKATNDGVFITAVARVMNKTDLIFLIKLDHRKVYSYEQKDKKAIMKEIQNTFIEDKRAIQKVAIIDGSDYFIWDVLAYDRNASGGKGLSKYFAGFLEVKERETPSKLTERTISVVRKWAKENQSFLNPDLELSVYKQRAIDYLLKAKKVKSSDLINAVSADPDTNRLNKLKKTLKHFFDDNGLTGQVYKPNIGSLKKAITKNIRKTAEGIKIEWEGSAEDVNIEIPQKVNPNDGLIHITIKTHQVDIIS